MDFLRILVLFGGCSTEYSISLQSAHGILSHMDPSQVIPIPVGITREGAWLYYTGPLDGLLQDNWHQDRSHCIPCTLSLDRGRRALLLEDGSGTPLSVDAAFPVLHGKNGEDGTVQGLLELAGIPLIGCGTLASALCMDKDRSHKLAALAGIQVPKGTVHSRGTPEAVLLASAREIGYPLFVKPVRSGSSFGVTRVEREAALLPAVEEAFLHDDDVILEEAIPGFEVGCAVLGNRELTVGAVDEISLSQGFFDFEEKYTLKTSAIYCPARIPAEQAAKIQQAAKTVYRALGCRVFARVDLFLTPDGRIVFNEVNTIPGFTPHSRYPGMMKGAGIEFDQLVCRLIELGMEP